MGQPGTKPTPSATLRHVALVGASTLKGKELKDVLEERSLAAADLRLLDDDESLGQLDAVGDEPTFIQAVNAESFHGADLAFFACESGFTRRNWELARRAGCALVDLSYGLEDEAGAVVRSPWVERELTGAAAGAAAGLVVVAHPAATVLALLMARARHAGTVRAAAATILEPASEQGRRGMDELHQQTVNLLSLRELPHQVFDTQVAFNLLSHYGSEAAVSLEAVERRVLRHFAQITGAGPLGAAASGPVPVPSVMLVQAPTFHGYGFSIYIELAAAPAAGDLEQALAGEHVEVARLAEDAPTNVTVAGHEEIQVAVRRDSLREQAFWVWATADNLKIAALTAAECAEAALDAAPPRRLQ